MKSPDEEVLIGNGRALIVKKVSNITKNGIHDAAFALAPATQFSLFNCQAKLVSAGNFIFGEIFPTVMSTIRLI